MPLAARVLDLTNHTGSITGPGALTVYIEKKNAARKGDGHACALAPPAGPHGANTIKTGSISVFIEKKPAARRDDACDCGAMISTNAITVYVG
jgi:uncharacterized Zn-binding protein involved in type VI secretion